jgi:hypothetical protein
VIDSAQDLKKTLFLDFCIIKPTTCTNFTDLFWHGTLRVSDSSSVHHQEFIHCTLSSGICHTAFEQDQHGMQFHPDPARKLSTNLYYIYIKKFVTMQGHMNVKLFLESEK